MLQAVKFVVPFQAELVGLFLLAAFKAEFVAFLHLLVLVVLLCRSLPEVEGAAFLEGAVALVELFAAFAELAEAPAEQLVLPQFAGQGAVEEWHDGRGLQANLVEQLFLVADDPRLVALKGVLQTGAEETVEVVEVVGLEAFAVGRVGHHDGRRFGLGELLQVAMFDVDVLRHACRADVGLSDVDGFPVVVVAVDMVVELAFGAVVVVDAVEELSIEVGPFLKGKLLAEHAWGDATCDEGGLDG